MIAAVARLAVLARVKNERDIIEAFVRHHVGLVDHVVVVDNASFDGTREILQRLCDEGLPLTVLDDEMIDYRQSAIMTYLARRVLSALGCVRLFLLDADEFLNAASKIELESKLAELPPDRHGLMTWSTYVLTPDDPLSNAVPERMPYRRVVEAVRETKVILSSAFLYQPDAIVAQGNHDVVSPSPRVRSSHVPDLTVAHYPVRSLEQLQIKVANGWAAYVARGYESASGFGSHWRRLFDLLTEEPAVFAASLYEIASAYPEVAGEPVPLVHDPIPWNAEVRYGQGATPNAIATMARASLEIARAYAGVRAAVERSSVEVSRALQSRSLPARTDML